MPSGANARKVAPSLLSPRIVTDGERDGQADAEQMLDELSDGAEEWSVSLWQSRKRQHNNLPQDLDRTVRRHRGHPRAVRDEKRVGLSDRREAVQLRDGSGAGLRVRRGTARVRRRDPAAVSRRGNSRVSRSSGEQEVLGSARAGDRGKGRRRTLAGQPRAGGSGAIAFFAYPPAASVLVNDPRECRG